ncbi:MAG: hypothetical protein M3N23_12095 [Pseudomonadota bacterium]|nr:hypothetical protein [Pseudomonadota bacterium]
MSVALARRRFSMARHDGRHRLPCAARLKFLQDDPVGGALALQARKTLPQ